MQRRYLVLGTLALLLASCGFHLRGAGGARFNTIVTHVCIEGVSTETGLGRELARVLQSHGIGVLPENSQQHPVPVLSVSPVEESRRVVSVDREVRAREFELVSRTRFSLHSPGDKTSPGEQMVEVRRDLVTNPDQVLGSQQEERQLQREMQQELARLLVLRLSLQ